MDINKMLAAEFKVRQEQIDNTVSLIDDGKTIPFIARYRKELTGSLDDQVLREIFERLTYLRNLEKRKSEILSSIEEQGKLTDEIKAAVSAASALVEVEDIYRPFKQKTLCSKGAYGSGARQASALHTFNPQKRKKPFLIRNGVQSKAKKYPWVAA